MTRAEMLRGLCYDAYPDKKETGRRSISCYKALACVECECPCLYGIEALKALTDEQFNGLKCGSGDCETCRQPCTLHRVAYMRDIRFSSALHGRKQKSWEEIALKPYYDRASSSAI